METEPGDVFSAAMVTVIGPLILIGLGLTVALMGNRIATFVGVPSAVVGLGLLVIGVGRLAA